MAFTKILYFYKINKLRYLKQYAKFNYFKIYLLRLSILVLPLLQQPLIDLWLSFIEILNTMTFALEPMKGDINFIGSSRVNLINLSPPHSRHSPSFPDRWSRACRLGAYCVVVLSQQIRTKKLTI